MSTNAYKDMHVTYIEIKKPKDAFVRQYKESVACRLVDDRKSIYVVLMKHVDRLKKIDSRLMKTIGFVYSCRT